MATDTREADKHAAAKAQQDAELKASQAKHAERLKSHHPKPKVGDAVLYRPSPTEQYAGTVVDVLKGDKAESVVVEYTGPVGTLLRVTVPHQCHATVVSYGPYWVEETLPADEKAK